MTKNYGPKQPSGTTYMPSSGLWYAISVLVNIIRNEGLTSEISASFNKLRLALCSSLLPSLTSIPPHEPSLNSTIKSTSNPVESL